VDLLPTLARRIGARFDQPGFTLPGRSLWPLLRAPWMPRRPAVLFAQRRPRDEAQRAYWEKGDIYSLQDLDWKYVVHTEGKDELYDLRSDALELKNLIDTASPVKPGWRRRARATLASLSREGARVGPAPADPRTIDELRALGYVN
jgi:arylsulfatase A-like enzyme